MLRFQFFDLLCTIWVLLVLLSACSAMWSVTFFLFYTRMRFLRFFLLCRWVLLPSGWWLLVVGSSFVGADYSSLRFGLCSWCRWVGNVLLLCLGVVGWWCPFMCGECCCRYQCGGIRSCVCMFVFCCGLVVHLWVFLCSVLLVLVGACWCFLHVLGWGFGRV